MALDGSNGNGMVMPVSPLYGGGGYGGGFGGFGGDGWWVILFLFALMGNWGGFGGFGGGMMGLGMADGMMLYPWMNQADITTSGFQNQMLNDTINSVRDGVTSLATQLCNTGSDIQMSLANGFVGVEQSANARQIANMQQSFANQTAMLQGFNGIQAQQAECCCENRLATCQTQNLVQNEGNATRFADANNTRDIITAITSGVQSIKDQLCQDKIDAKNDEIAQLRQENLYARGQASQIAQNSTIIDGIYNRLNQCPVGTVPVYGEQPIFTCPNNLNNNGCGCGCGNF